MAPGLPGNDAFNDWGWRVPFLISFLLVMMAIYIRLQLGETPIFQAMKAKGGMVRNPWKEAFLSPNIKFILVAIVVLIGQGVVWYSGQFWALYFLQTVKKLDVLTSSYLVGAALLIAIADVDSVRMALRHHRPEAGHSGGNVAGSPDVLPAVFVAW